MKTLITFYFKIISQIDNNTPRNGETYTRVVSVKAEDIEQAKEVVIEKYWDFETRFIIQISSPAK